MTGLEVLLAITGVTVTVFVVVGMILITPRGEIDLHDADASDPQGSDLSRPVYPSARTRTTATVLDSDPERRR